MTKNSIRDLLPGDTRSVSARQVARKVPAGMCYDGKVGWTSSTPACRTTATPERVGHFPPACGATQGAPVADSRQVTDGTAPAEKRQFGYWAGHFVVVGSMIGAGILTTSGYTLKET